MYEFVNFLNHYVYAKLLITMEHVFKIPNKKYLIRAVISENKLMKTFEWIRMQSYFVYNLY